MHKDDWIWLLIMVSLAGLAGLGVVGVRLWNQSQANQPVAAATASPSDGSTTGLTANLPLLQGAQGNLSAAGPAWEPVPPCANAPLTVNEVLAMGNQLAPASGQPLPVSALAYQVLRLNLASGRLNRATGIRVQGFPEIQTVGDLLARMESGENEQSRDEPQAGLLAVGPDPAFAPALEAVLSGAAITRPVCARLALLSEGRLAGTLDWAAQEALHGQMAPAQMASGQLAAANPRQVSLDSGLASPDGVWAAYTSLGMDAGGPIFIQNLQSGAWTNLIALMNKVRASQQPELSESDWWTVIDWFPDSQHVMIARSDASSALVVDTISGEWLVYPFPGEGNGGSAVLDLQPDGSRFVYLGFDADGRQALTLFDFASEKATHALRAPLSEGVIYFPRFSPDGSQLAYLWQQGDPLAGMSYSIRLLNLADGAVRELVAGNVGFIVPTWSPDGAHIAYVRSDSGQAQRVVEGQLPEVESTNLWVVRLEDGVMTRVTTLAGQARSPQWANDSRTLAFITEDGQVGMASLDEPGRMWAAAGPAAFPLLSAVFFVP